jgi:hypothetical protein
MGLSGRYCTNSKESNEKRKTILVTGSHRSGSTWAEQILAIAPNTGYIHEPFNNVIKCGVIANPFEYSFHMYVKRTQMIMKRHFAELFTTYTLWVAI